MANSNTYVCYKIIHFFICLELFVFILVSSAKFCYVGMNANSKEALLNQSCITNKSHLSESLLATEYIHDIKNKQPSNNSSNGVTGASMEHCYIFRHILSETLPSDIKKESVQTKFACDFEGVCKGKDSNVVIDNIVLKGEFGKLYCCHQDNCNDIDKMPRAPAENQICFLGNNSKVAFESCSHPDTYCMTKTQIVNGETVETYSCDNEKSCDNLDGHGAYKFCQNTQKDNITQQVCCCVSNKCNKPSDLSLISKIEESPDSSLESSSTDSWKKIVHPMTNPITKDKSKQLVKGLVASIIAVALAGILVLLVMAYRRRKRRDGSASRDPNVIMQYERLSCSDASLEGSVSV